MDRMAQFDIEDLTFTYPGAARPALKDVSLSIKDGSFVCLCGRSGCGKTTLLRHLKTVLTPHGDRRGRVLFHGQQLTEVCQRDQSRFIGFVAQDPDAQIVTDKVWSELAFGLESLGVDPRVMRLRVAEMASYLGIQHWFHQDVAKLSGGQKQLLNLASVMAMQPSVLILDEPTSQLDPIAAADLLGTIRKINEELGITIIITEHRLEDVYAASDVVVVMEAGRITHEGSPREVALELARAKDAMAYALPAPLRAYALVEGAQADGVEGEAFVEEAPLTVREGRAWLLDYALRHDLPVRSLPDAAPQGEEVSDAEAVLKLKDVWFRYERDGADVLRGLSLEVPRGQVHAILGGNGTGKSTLLKAACGLLRPYRGRVEVLGRRVRDWKGNSLFRGGVALLPQDPQNLFSKKTVREELEEMVRSQGGEGQEGEVRSGGDPGAEAKRSFAYDVCDIRGLLDQHPLDLSGGEQQRVALAKVLLCDPQVLLLDEPTKGLDALFKRELAARLASLASGGMTIVMVSHDVEFCARYATSVSLLFDGSVITTNTPQAFFAESAFYTTSANRMSRQVFTNAITAEDVAELCLQSS